jgi:protein-tyrosine phosphatase
MVELLRRLWPGRTLPQADMAKDEARVQAPGVLFVCMGNICRSPCAQGVLQARLQAAGLSGRVRVDSAGTSGHHAGEPPDPRARQQAAMRGYDVAALRARAVEPVDFERFDLVLAMDRDNLGWLAARRPEGARARLALVMSFARRHPAVDEVPDPYYGPAVGFDRVLDLLEDACDGLLDDLSARLAAGPLPPDRPS